MSRGHQDAPARWFWQIAHTILAAIIVVGGIGHAVLIEGVMGEASKLVLYVSLGIATTATVIKTARTAWASRTTPAG